MAVNISGLRRNIKNVAHNYTDAQVKVREATSNDPWGPSSTMMSEIADLTYNVVAFSEIMQMVWKRLNDNGKNWRHVYKALVLLEYLIKTGSEKVAQQCKENIFAIQTLKDFQYLDDNKDQGINVREKAKALVALLKDDERLKNERVRALKAKERFAQSQVGIGNDTVYTTHGRDRYDHQQLQHHMGGHGGHHLPSHRSPSDFDAAGMIANSNPEIEAARPQTAGEEELQLQLALAMSREEAEQEESKSKSDDMRLQLALQKSQQEEEEKRKREKPSNDLLDLDFGNPKMAMAAAAAASSSSSALPAVPVRTEASHDPWGMPLSPPQQQAPPPHNDPWGSTTQATHHHPGAAAAAAPNDPWGAPQPMRVSPANMQHGSPQPMFKESAAAATEFSDNDPWTAVKHPRMNNNNNNNHSVSSTDAGGRRALNLDAGHSALEDDELFSPQAQYQLAEFDLLRSEIEKEAAGGMGGGVSNNGGTSSPNPFDLKDVNSGLPESTGAKPKKSVKTLLGEHSNLVNLDNLVSGVPPARNPFEQQQQNPFQVKTTKPPLKELMNKNQTGNWSDGATGASTGAKASNGGGGGNPQQMEFGGNQAEFNPFF